MLLIHLFKIILRFFSEQYKLLASYLVFLTSDNVKLFTKNVIARLAVYSDLE